MPWLASEVQMVLRCGIYCRALPLQVRTVSYPAKVNTSLSAPAAHLLIPQALQRAWAASRRLISMECGTLLSIKTGAIDNAYFANLALAVTRTVCDGRSTTRGSVEVLSGDEMGPSIHAS